MSIREPDLALRDWSLASDVVLVRWPEQLADRERLARRGVPRLLLVAANAEPPICTSAIEDWIRLPVDDADLRARMIALVERRIPHSEKPLVDEYGQVSFRGARLFLSPREHEIVHALATNYANVVRGEELQRTTWGGTGNGQALRVHISRLRRRLTPLGLAITCVRGIGYILHEPEGGAGAQPR